jgi:hypothetical protein
MADAFGQGMSVVMWLIAGIFVGALLPWWQMRGQTAKIREQRMKWVWVGRIASLIFLVITWVT